MDDQVKRILKHHDISYSEVNKIQTGLFNSTYKIETNNNEKLVLRIAPDEATGTIFYETNMMLREPHIHHQVQQHTKIPVPKILLSDFSMEVVPNWYLLMEYMPGQPMSEAPVSLPDQKKIYKKTGEYLKELHNNVISEKFGYPENHYMKMQNDWFSAFTIMWNSLMDDISSCGVYNSKENSYAKQQLQNAAFAFDRNVPASLLHMDIWSQNILISENHHQISAMLDWDRALYGDPEIEFAVLEYVGFMNDSFLEGYGEMVTSGNYAIRNIFYYLYEFQKYMVIWTLRRPNPSMVKKYKEYALNELNHIL